MESISTKEITQLLTAWGNGDQNALNQLIPLVYQELHRLAGHYMRKENKGHTLQTTALVNEAYCRLIDQKAKIQNRAQFFGIAANLMRRILLDHARAHARIKRRGSAQVVSLDEAAIISQTKASELISIDEALTRLNEIDAMKSRIVEMKFFGGLSIDEIAEVEKVSSRTIDREWRKAKVWLYREVQK
ncbi:MAG TPA: sigma-70 family RNA polymerase sigma factor [Acidobacteriota bacterium]|jgi:RNA polymerase sigma factor (TIGR02999 family)